ncbi:transmembrane protein, putative (macronuclear) [Tetrahymena thermophila SB210]|uniref:Transmembrane protein, putative n=1 Tax=Tetrahymena thermophila (strain SB210) TaxID=312017 RepID=Q22MR7_TETTS|nr:transmembrane protein, putative [Tetrahymena thermophila SB210]EAR86590.1 transmembrane protein, putative [Tetrahymena thermophila SB210]|eukprot:XP_976953.1 transmembrane protein, putative [Tetrahymena thermophila SB210]
MVQFIYLLTIIVSLTLAQNTNTNPFIYVTPASSTPANYTSSQDLDLINYDSANCVCDITYLRDYDCSCDTDTQTNQQNYFTTKRKTTMEQSYMLINYPLCDTLRNDINELIPSYINNIACLARQNKAYSGMFYNSQETSTTSSTSSTSTQVDYDLLSMTQIDASKPTQFLNYNINDFLLFYENYNYAQLSSNPNRLSSAQLLYAPDFFGFCRLLPVLKRDIINYSTLCQGQVVNRNQIELISDENGNESVKQVSNVAGNSNNFIIYIKPNNTQSTVTAKDQGYSYGNYLNVDQRSIQYQQKIKFGGIFYLSSANLYVYSLKQVSGQDAISCTGIQQGDTTQQYIIYFTDIGTKDNTSFQIIYCQASPVITQSKVSGKTLVSFQYLSSSDIIQEQSYTDRLSKYVYRLFYPLYSFLSASKLVFTLSTLLGLLSILFF